MKQPLISVIIPTYNAGKTLEKAIRSIIDQSFGAYEILIVDGLSSDNTLAVAESFNDERIKIIAEKDKGVYDAMNKGISKASGKWLYFLGSDDYLVNNAVFENIAQDLVNKNPDLLYGKVFWGDTGKIYGMKYTRERLIYSNICHQAMFYKKELFDELGFYNLKFRTCADWDFNFRVFEAGGKKLVYKDIIVAYFNLAGLSNNNYDAEIVKVLQQKSDELYKNPYYKVKKEISSLRSKVVSLFRGE